MGESNVKPAEVLIEQDGWSIKRSWERPSEYTVRPEWYHDNSKSYLMHRCPGEKVVISVFVWPDNSNNCWRCTTPIPDEIKGLWIMHNWEAIQNER